MTEQRAGLLANKPQTPGVFSGGGPEYIQSTGQFLNIQRDRVTGKKEVPVDL